MIIFEIKTPIHNFSLRFFQKITKLLSLMHFVREKMLLNFSMILDKPIDNLEDLSHLPIQSIEIPLLLTFLIFVLIFWQSSRNFSHMNYLQENKWKIEFYQEVYSFFSLIISKMLSFHKEDCLVLLLKGKISITHLSSSNFCWFPVLKQSLFSHFYNDQ